MRRIPVEIISIRRHPFQARCVSSVGGQTMWPAATVLPGCLFDHGVLSAILGIVASARASATT